MTEDELKAIEERAKKATTGPWYWHQPTGFGADCFLRSKTDRTYSEYTYIASGMSGFDNCEFIAHSREDIPKLIAALRAARGAMAAQDERERKAGEVCGVKYEQHGCDWPEWVADALVSKNRLIAEFVDACSTIRHEIRDFGQMGHGEMVALLTRLIDKASGAAKPDFKPGSVVDIEARRAELMRKHKETCQGCCPCCGDHCPEEGGTSCGGHGHVGGNS